MYRLLIILTFCCMQHTYAQQQGIPKWFIEEMAAEVGVWTADNTTYQNENEPFDAYEIEWQWGLNKKTLTGKLYGVIGNARQTAFWEFRKYWNAEKGLPEVLQMGGNGTIGRGYESKIGEKETELLQVFTSVDGSSNKVGHREKWISDTEKASTAYNVDENGNWEKTRYYLWKKQKAKRIATRVDSTSSSELVLIQEFTVDSPVERVWEAYTTKAGWESWAVPIAEVDLKVGGTIKTNYNKNGHIGDSTTIVTHIINYVPQRVLTLQAEMTDSFPEFMKKEEKDFFNVLVFDALEDGRTQVRSYGIGYKKTDKYRNLMKFFIQANEMTTQHLIRYLETGEKVQF